MPVKRKYIDIECANCGVTSKKRKDHADRSDKHFCSRKCGMEQALRTKIARSNAAISKPEEFVKKCSVCGEIKKLTEFHKGNYKYGRRPNCKACRKKPDAVEQLKWRDIRLKKAYGIGVLEYDEMYALQKGCCAICNEASALLFVDHDHATGAVRQLLCGKCNSGIGMLKEDIRILISAIAYLEKHNAS